MTWAAVEQVRSAEERVAGHSFQDLAYWERSQIRQRHRAALQLLEDTLEAAEHVDRVATEAFGPPDSPDYTDTFSEAHRALHAVLARARGQQEPQHPDPSSHGGHPYTPTEKAIGYGTPNDPRFKEQP